MSEASPPAPVDGHDRDTASACSMMAADQRTDLNCFLVGSLILLLIPVWAASLFPLDVGPDATQLPWQVWQLCIWDLLVY